MCPLYLPYKMWEMTREMKRDSFHSVVCWSKMDGDSAVCCKYCRSKGFPPTHMSVWQYGWCDLLMVAAPQSFIMELVAKLDGVHKQKDLQSEGIEHPVISHSHHRHEPYHFNNPHHHQQCHHSRGQNQTLWPPPASHLAPHQNCDLKHVLAIKNGDQRLTWILLALLGENGWA